MRILNISCHALIVALSLGVSVSAARADVAISRLVDGSVFRSINGVTFTPDGQILTTSMGGETIHKFNIATGKVSVVVEPGEGRSDDIVVSLTGDLIWTDPRSGVVRRMSDNGEIRDIAKGLRGVNSIAFNRDGKRLFVGQTGTGDGLWEIDPDGVREPRLVAAKTGGVNAFSFGPDGKIYGPVTVRNTLVRVDPESGKLETLIEGLHHPVSARFDQNDQLYVINGANGELLSVDIDTRSTKHVATVAPAVDSMSISPQGNAYVSNMADNAIIEVNLKTGDTRALTESPLAFPRDIDMVHTDSGGILYVADGTAFRSIDATTGKVSEIARRMTSALRFPSGISVNSQHAVLISEILSDTPRSFIQVVDLKTGKFLYELTNFEAPSDAVELPDGSLIVAEALSGQLLRVNADKRSVLVEGLGAPSSLVLGDNNVLYVAESTAGRIAKVDVDSGKLSEVISGLGAVRAIAVAPDKTLIALISDGQLLAIDPSTKKSTVIAKNLPVGYLTEPYPRSGGLAVGHDGTIYIAADKESAIYRITRP